MAVTKIGIIGLGGIANGKHIRELTELDSAKIVAVCDIDEEKLTATGDKLNIPADHRFKDYHDLIACAER